MAKPKLEQIQSAVQRMVQDAVDFVDSEIRPIRIKCAEYAAGKSAVPVTPGRSTVVATKCRDAVRAVKPSIMRTFLAASKPVEWIPRSPKDVDAAAQMTAYAQAKFEQSGGYMLLASAIDDALVKKQGIAKVMWEESAAVTCHTYENLTDDVLTEILSDPELTVVEASQEIGPDGVTLTTVTVERVDRNGNLVIEPVPPEEFFIDRYARRIEDATVCGHRANGTVADLVAMGVRFEDAINLDAGEQSEEDIQRRATMDGGDIYQMGGLRRVQITEAYVRLDPDNTGVAKLYRFICGGTNYKVLLAEPWDEIPFAVFEIDPVPHAFFGQSLVELLLNDQDVSTLLLRGMLDNAAQVNNPRTKVNDDLVNMDDLLNNEIGGIVRTKDVNAIADIVVPSMVGAILPAMQYHDESIEQKTGVTRASLGLNADALQGTTKAAVDATVAGASGQAEIITRNLAETGLKRLFQLMLFLTAKHAPADEMVQMHGQYVPVDPRSWNLSLHMSVNVGIGTARQEERTMMLRELFQTQIMMMQGGLPLVGVEQLRNTQADMLKMAGLPNVDRYFATMEEIQQQAQMQQQTPPEPDPNMLIAEAERMKAEAQQLRARAAIMEAQADLEKAERDRGTKAQLEERKMAQANDLARDKLATDAFFKAAELEAKTGVPIDPGAIQTMREAVN